ncbi:MAG TPA: hypothetical protein VF144_16885 [Chitinophagaceae bacterium]
MDHSKSIFLLFITPFLFSDSSKQDKIIDNLFTDTIISKAMSAYEVRFSFTGYQSFNGDLTNCPVRPSGTVVLKGTLEGNENPERDDDDIVYRGTLQLDMDIDICSVKGEGDNAKPCAITLTGSGLVKTELAIYYDGRGGYIQIRDTTSRGFRKNASGTCDQGEVNEERTMIPLKTIATIFNGLDLPMLTTRTLRAGPSQFFHIDGGEVLVEVLRKVRE